MFKITQIAATDNILYALSDVNELYSFSEDTGWQKLPAIPDNVIRPVVHPNIEDVLNQE